ncbi:transposase [Colletotrichum incanum]|nr:transposase [Colletotrichum incanum]
MATFWSFILSTKPRDLTPVAFLRTFLPRARRRPLRCAGLTHIRDLRNAGRNFASDEFYCEAQAMAIDVKIVPVKAYYSIRKVKRSYVMVRRAYDIIRANCPAISKDAALQAALKAVNNTAGPDGIVLTLLVFGAKALAACNGLETIDLKTTEIGSLVRVWREGRGWSGLYKLIAVTYKTYTVNIKGPKDF